VVGQAGGRTSDAAAVPAGAVRAPPAKQRPVDSGFEDTVQGKGKPVDLPSRAHDAPMSHTR
jgi:hypothetical protein